MTRQDDLEIIHNVTKRVQKGMRKESQRKSRKIQKWVPKGGSRCHFRHEARVNKEAENKLCVNAKNYLEKHSKTDLKTLGDFKFDDSNRYQALAEEDSIDSAVENSQDESDEMSFFSDFDLVSIGSPEKFDYKDEWEVLSLAESEVSEDFNFDTIDYEIESVREDDVKIVVALARSFRDALLSNKPSLLSTFITIELPKENKVYSDTPTQSTQRPHKVKKYTIPKVDAIQDEENDVGNLMRYFAKSKGSRRRTLMSSHRKSIQ